MRTAILSLLLLNSFFIYAVQDPSISSIKTAINEQLQSTDDNIQFKITSSSTSHNGLTHYYGTQLVEGKEVYGAYFNAAFSGDMLIRLNQSFIPNAKGKVSKNQATYTAKTAFLKLIADFGFNEDNWIKISELEYHYTDRFLSDETIKIKLKWFYKDKVLVPIAEVSLYNLDHQHWYNSRLSLITGELLDRDDWVVSCSIESHDHDNDFSGHKTSPKLSKLSALQMTNGTSSYNVFALPVESPNHGNRSVVVDPHDTVASPFGWHDVNGAVGHEYVITRGNNVYASEDKDADNSPGATVNGGSSLIFDSNFDKDQSASLFTDASITNLFYWNNMMHDVWYNYGFDEQSGNFQQNNYGNGGKAGDYVNADAQDGSGTNNANFATPPDGGQPRMQMYIWNSGASSSDYLQVNSPSVAEGKYLASLAAFGPQLTSTPITADLVITDPQRACGSIANSTALNGKIAYVERGTCTFVEKVKNCQDAGALAVVIYDSTGNDPIYMGGTDNTITIPVVMIKRTDGIFIRNLISSGVNVSLYDSGSIGSTVFDSDFDAGIIAHEYGHGISNRLTGGPDNASCLTNQEQMGEGWSDFFGLVMTVEAGDTGTDIRGVGTYVTNQSTTGGGIRPYPYSTDLSISPYTYNDIKTFSVPHGVGSVWCSMLWDMYWAFVDEYGYDSDIYRGTGGNNMAMQLVIDGMKLQACNPGFEDGRDAILLADQINNGGANQKMIWEVFARRGLGYGADQGSSDSRTDGVTAFDIPPIYKDALFVDKTAVSTIENDSVFNYRLVAKNYSGATIYNIKLSDTLPGGLKVYASDLSCATSFIDNIIVIELDSLQHTDSFICEFPAQAKFPETSTQLFFDNVENGQGDWVIQNDLNNNPWAIASIRKYSGTKAWYVDDVESSSDQSLIHSFDLEGAQPTLSFYHYYNTEKDWDGGVVELKVQGNWIDAGPYFTQNGYNAVITQNQASALSGRDGFTGNSGRWIQSIIDLSDFSGITIEVRFRFASDGLEGGDGWYIDDIQLDDAVQVVNYLHASYEPNKESRAVAKTFVTGDGLQLSIPEAEVQENLSIYPNPTESSLYIEWDIDSEYTVVLIDPQSQVVAEANAKKSYSIDLNELAAGVYILELRAENQIIRRKIIKQ